MWKCGPTIHQRDLTTQGSTYTTFHFFWGTWPRRLWFQQRQGRNHAGLAPRFHTIQRITVVAEFHHVQLPRLSLGFNTLRREGMGSSQFPHFTTGSMLGISLPFWFLGGVNIRGAGEGKLLAQGEIGEGEYSRRSELLRISFSGDSISLSLILMSDLILCAKGERAVVESVWVLTCNAACRRWAQAEATWRSDPFLGGGRVEDAAKAAWCSTERR